MQTLDQLAQRAQPLWQPRTPPRRVEPDQWRDEGLCAEFEEPAAFFPRGRARDDVKALCRACPVRDLCLETALSSDYAPYGVWAGMSGPELRPKWKKRHQEEL